MGQASRRGAFEERKAQAIARREEQRRINREAYLLRQAERDALMDRQDAERCTDVATKQGERLLIVDDGYSRRRRTPTMMLMAAMLAATAGSIHPQALSDARYR